MLLLIGLAHVAVLLALTHRGAKPSTPLPSEPLAVSLLASPETPQTAVADAALPTRMAPLPAAPALSIPTVSTEQSPAAAVLRATPEPASLIAANTPAAPEVALTRVDIAPVTLPSAAAPAPPPRKRVSASAVQYRVVPPAEVPRASRRAGESGTVWLRVVVDTAGVPASVAVHLSSGFARLDEQALWAMRQARFTPHLEDGQAVEVEVIAPIEYPAG